MNQTETTGTPDKPVVTIFEYYGAGADYVGHKVAEALGLPFHQQAFSSEEIEAGQDSVNEQGAVLAQVFSVLGGAYGGFDGRDVATTQRQKYDLVMENNSQVWQYADEGGVILGRNGAVILADRPNTLHVLLTGAVEDRIERAATESGITVETGSQAPGPRGPGPLGHIPGHVRLGPAAPGALRPRDEHQQDPPGRHRRGDRRRGADRAGLTTTAPPEPNRPWAPNSPG